LNGLAEKRKRKETYALVAVADIKTFSICIDVRSSCIIITDGEATPANARAKPKMPPDIWLFANDWRDMLVDWGFVMAVYDCMSVRTVMLERCGDVGSLSAL